MFLVWVHNICIHKIHDYMRKLCQYLNEFVHIKERFSWFKIRYIVYAYISVKSIRIDISYFSCISDMYGKLWRFINVIIYNQQQHQLEKFSIVLVIIYIYLSMHRQAYIGMMYDRYKRFFHVLDNLIYITIYNICEMGK